MRASLRALLCTGVLTLGAGPARALPRGPGEEPAPLEERVARLLLAEPAQEDDALALLARGLARLGPDGIPALLGTLERGRVPGAEGEPPAELSALQEEALFAALASFEPATLARRLAAALGERPPPERRLVALELLGRIGTRDELRLAWRAATPADEGQPLERRVESAFERAVERILRRDPGAFLPLKQLIDDSGPDVSASLVISAASAGSPRALELAADLLGWDAERDLLLLTQIARLGAVVPRPVDEHLLAAARDYLRAEDPQLVRAAALACGRLEDSAAADALIGLLASKERAPRDAAHWALEHMSGVHLLAEPARWRTWLQGERQWLAGDARRLIADLRHEDPARVVAALTALSQHRFRRDLLARELAVALDDRRPEIRRAGCLALGRLGSPAAILDLARCLEDQSLAAAQEAHTALQLITGADLPAQSEAWARAYPAD